jgi:hypothetical protein
MGPSISRPPKGFHTTNNQRRSMNIRKLAMVGAMSLAALGLIGIGAHAVFTTSVASNQAIEAGTAAVTLSGSCLAGPCPAFVVSPDGTTLTWAAVGPVGSTFTTGDEMVTATNTGNIAVTDPNIDLTVTPPASALATEAYACVSSSGISPGIAYDGPLSGLAAAEAGWSPSTLSLTPAGVAAVPGVSANTDNYIIDVYAGDVTTACSGDGVVAPSLANDAEGESLTVGATVTLQG